MIDILDFVRVLLFNKLDARLDWVKCASENYNRFQLHFGQRSAIEPVRLDVGLNLITLPPIRALLGARILEFTPAFGI